MDFREDTREEIPLQGACFLDRLGDLVFSRGIASNTLVSNQLSDPKWLRDALAHRKATITFKNISIHASVHSLDNGHLILLGNLPLIDAVYVGDSEIAQYQQESLAQLEASRILQTIIGESEAVLNLKEQLKKVAPLNIPVLIQGESGTGKELVAHALHRLSNRSSGPMIAVNAAAIPETLVESELFGYAPGSFTGADRKGRKGKFEQADKGTMFLDEIGDMPMEVQAKLLRVLQDQRVERIGDVTARPVDFRLCCATNHNLNQRVQDKQFRLDLFFRVSPVTLYVPSLAERIDDIPLLVEHFLQRFALRYNRQVLEVDSEVYDHLKQRAWPGNIRQLQHEIEGACVFVEPGTKLQVQDLDTRPHNPKIKGEANSSDGTNSHRLQNQVDNLEKEIIQEAMERFSGNKSQIAEHLGISRGYLYKILERM